jgi:ADP-ribosylglycohydrolase
MMTGGGTYNTNSGQGTDETEIAFSLAYGLIESGGLYNSDIIAKHYSIWLKSKPFDISALILIALKDSRNYNID